MRKQLMVLLVVLVPVSAWAAGSDELWEMTTSMDMPGMAMPAVVHRVCTPKNEAYKPEKGPDEKNCEMTDIRFSGNTTKWKMHCTGRDAMDGSGEMTRSADTMKGTMKMSMQNMQLTQHISGKRVGACQAK